MKKTMENESKGKRKRIEKTQKTDRSKNRDKEEGNKRGE